MTVLFRALVVLALLVALGLPLALLGMPVAPFPVIVSIVVLFPLARRVRLPSLSVEERWPRPVVLQARIALISAVALFLVKVVLAPLWSWDHFAIWGLKSRRMVVQGRLDLGFLAERAWTLDLAGSGPSPDALAASTRSYERSEPLRIRLRPRDGFVARFR